MRMRIVSSTLAAAVAVLATLGPVYGRVITFDTRDVSISGTSNNDMGKLMVRAAFAQNDRAEEEEVSQTTSRPARTTSSASEDEEEEPTSTSTSTASRKEEPTKTAEEEYKATAPAGKKVEGEVLAGENGE
ncbi:hypothetical protein BJ508DRAFT_181696 [Ascobolus immersus RN42]|uniref:Uncharacterized protein n=1 Tax=Ascobolus immersus RN42 TaxID=1160509 RepID=A0A3N4I4F5_ASCIM|nr:hypothetical protein BJ508DRAFT_181696 [Ascobolus immersus RN42]